MTIQTNCTWEDRPSQGQFICVWEYQGAIWSQTYLSNYRGILQWDDAKQDWIEAATPSTMPNLTFITLP